MRKIKWIVGEPSGINHLDDGMISLLVQEYLQMRTEVTAMVHAQDKTLGFSVTLCLGLFSIMEYLGNNATALYYLFMGALAPSAVCFVGIYVLDLMFQQKRYDAYIAKLEIDINNYISQSGTTSVTAFSWNRFLSSSIPYFDKRGAKRNENLGIFLRHMIVLGAVITVPIFMVIFTYHDIIANSTMDFFPAVASLFSGITQFSASVFSVVYVVYGFFLAYYIRRILRIHGFTKQVFESMKKEKIALPNKPRADMSQTIKRDFTQTVSAKQNRKKRTG